MINKPGSTAQAAVFIHCCPMIQQLKEAALCDPKFHLQQLSLRLFLKKCCRCENEPHLQHLLCTHFLQHPSCRHSATSQHICCGCAVPLQIVCFCSNLMHSHLYYSCITPYTNTMLLAPYSLSQWNSSRRFTANGLPIHYTN